MRMGRKQIKGGRGNDLNRTHCTHRVNNAYMHIK